MVVYDLFPIQIFEFVNNELDNNDIIFKLQEMNAPIRHSTNLSHLIDIHDNHKLSNLFNWIRTCLEEIRIKMKYDCDKFEISNSWFNRCLPYTGMHQNYHRHTMSFFSGIYYLTAGSPTVFEDPVHQRIHNSLEVLQHDYEPTERTFPVPGKLIVFPSWLFHQSPPHTENYERWIISFNVLPTGNINSISHDAKCFIKITE